MKKLFKIVTTLFIVLGMSTPVMGSGPVSQAAPRPGAGYHGGGRPNVNDYDLPIDGYSYTRHRYNSSKYELRAKSRQDQQIITYSNSLTNWYFNNVMNYATSSTMTSPLLKNAIRDAKKHPGYYKKCMTYNSHNGYSTIYDINKRMSSDRARYTYTKKFLDGILVGCYNNR
jgi:hypothetical protein